MTMDNVGARQAAIQLEQWLSRENPAPHIETRGDGRGKHTPSRHTSDNTSQDGSVRYTQEVDAWFDELLMRRDGEVDCDYWKRTRNGVKRRLIESYRIGQKSKVV